MKVRIHIERLVLDGVGAVGSHDVLRAALEQELARLVARGGLAPSLGTGIAVPSIAAPSIAAAGGPAPLGHAIAGAVYRGLGRL